MTKEITIQKVPVTVSAPYIAGHPITEAEAKALNQVRAENIGNNLRSRIKELLSEAGDDVAAATPAAQELASTYDAEYEFTLASVGGGRRTLDPLEKECRSIATAFITNKLREAGVTKKAWVEANGDDAFKSKVAEVAANEVVIKQAKKALAEREKMASLDLAL